MRALTRNYASFNTATLKSLKNVFKDLVITKSKKRHYDTFK